MAKQKKFDAADHDGDPETSGMLLSTDLQPITVSVSLSRKINLGNYESVDVFVSLSNVPSGADQADIEAALVTAEDVFNHLRTKIVEKVRMVKGPGAS